MLRSRLRLASSVGGSPGRCFLKSSTSASSTVWMESFSSVLAMKGLLSKAARISSSVPVAMKPGSSPVSVFLTPARARRNTVAGSLRFRSMRTLTVPRLSISNSSQEPRAGMRLAIRTCLAGSLALMT